MAVPDYEDMIGPVLDELAKTGQETSAAQLTGALAAKMRVMPYDLQALLPSGKETVFENRVRWALVYLQRDQLVAGTQDDGFCITAAGLSCLSAQNGGPGDEPAGFSEAPDNFAGQGAGGIANRARADIADNFETLYQRLKKNLLVRVHEQPPEFFEALIIDLLLAMGYGGRRDALARRLGRSGDGGVDGAIDQDPLGLDVIYVQAKRYKPGLAVPVSALRDFIGALEAQKAGKGVFVTTSHFPASAAEFVKSVSHHVALVDGEMLASLMIRHDIGVRLQQVYELKRIDGGYFDRP